MLKEDCEDMFNRIPKESHAQINLVLKNCFVVSVDVAIRFEEGYVVVRGREGGTTDEGRAFFVPYEEISYIRLERVVRIGELKAMYGETGYIDAEDRLSSTDPQQQQQQSLPTPAASGTGSLNGGGSSSSGSATDPGSIAKQNLLNRIRAARANVGGATGKLGGGKR